MHPLPSTTADLLAPTPSGNQSTGSPPVGEESFSKHLANETARESTGDTESALSYGREIPGTPLQLNQIAAETESQLRIFLNSAANTTDSILEAQQSQLANIPGETTDSILETQQSQLAHIPGETTNSILEAQQSQPANIPGEKNKDASPLMVLLDKLSAQQTTTHPLTGNAESSSPSTAIMKGVVPAEVIGQQQKPSALQQQLTALSEILTQGEPTTSTLQSSSLKADAPQSIQQSLQQGAQSTIPGTVQLMPGNESSPSVTVEQWSATFKPVQAQPGQTENTAAVSPTPMGENVIKTESGQTITIYHSSDNEEMAVATPLAARPSTVDQSGQRQDANSNYIHSNLPNNTGKTAMGAEGDPQAKNGGEQQPDPKNLSTASELGTEPRLSRETAPVPFTLDSVVPTVSTPTSPATTPGAGLMKLQSGATFQESAVVDQVINHFSAAKKLESGSIRLQLHPQELGELRMEIEVKQDNVKAHITAQNPQAQEALDRHLPRLRETLAQQGLHLNEVEITVAAGDQYDGNHFQQNSARHQLGKSYRLGNIPTTDIAPITDEESSPVNESKQGLSVTV